MSYISGCVCESFTAASLPALRSSCGISSAPQNVCQAERARAVVVKIVGPETGRPQITVQP